MTDQNKGRNTVQNLIDERKARLAQIIMLQALDRITGKRSILSNVTEAVKDNAETDQLMKDWAWENIDLDYCVDNCVAF